MEFIEPILSQKNEDTSNHIFVLNENVSSLQISRGYVFLAAVESRSLQILHPKKVLGGPLRSCPKCCATKGTP